MGLFTGDINDKKVLKYRLTISSYFIMLYESFSRTWKDRFLEFYANSVDVSGDKPKYRFTKPKSTKNGFEMIPDKKAENDFYNKVFRIIKKSKGYDKELSMFKYMEKLGFINAKQYIELIEIRKIRNVLTHELDSCILDNFPNETKNLLKKLIEIRKSANKNWILSVEIATGDLERYKDDNGTYNFPKEAFSLDDILFDLIKENIF